MRDLLSQVWQSMTRRPLTCVLAAISLGTGVAAFLAVAALANTTMTGPWVAYAHRVNPLVCVVGVCTPTMKSAKPDTNAYQVAKRFSQQVHREVAFTNFGTINSIKAGRRLAKHAQLRAMSGNASRPEFRDQLTLREGRLLTAKDELAGTAVCTLSSELAERLFPDRQAVGRSVRLDGWPFAVVGVTQPRIFGSPDNPGVVQIPYSIARTRFRETNARPCPDMLMFVADMETLPEEMMDAKQCAIALADSITGTKEEHASLYVTSPYVEMEGIRRSMFTVRLMVMGLSILLLAAGLLGMVSMLLANLGGRIHEIGVHRALGATRQRQAVLVLIEALITGILGSLVGIQLGYGVLTVANAGFRSELSLSVGWVLTAVAVSAGTSLLAGLIPARAAMKISPAEALRAE